MNTQTNGNLHKAAQAATGSSAASKGFEEFVYLLSHDVRNSIRALVEVPQWIKEDLIAEGHSIQGSTAENFDLMDTHTRRLDRMFADLLVYSRVGNKQTVQSVDLAVAIEQVLSQLNTPTGFQITHDIKHKIIRIGDQDILTLLSAVISNAFKHHDRDVGAVHISSWQEASECVVHISDDGPGIPLKFRDKVFDIMTTLKSRDEVEGSGMGLSVTRKIVELYAGSLGWVSDEQERGVTLEIRFQI